MTDATQLLSFAAAAARIDPKHPPYAETLRIWHDRVGGPRDPSGRRIFTEEVCDRIRAARPQRAPATSTQAHAA